MDRGCCQQGGKKTQMRFLDEVKEDMQCWCDIGGS